MKKIYILLISIGTIFGFWGLFSCNTSTQVGASKLNKVSKEENVIHLPKGRKFISASRNFSEYDNSFWYSSRKMKDNEEPDEILFTNGEESVIFVETK